MARKLYQKIQDLKLCESFVACIKIIGVAFFIKLLCLHDVSAREIGVMFHYLPETVNLNAIQTSDYEKTVIRLKNIGVKHVIITLGQNNGEFWLRNHRLASLCRDYKGQSIKKAEYFEKIIDALNQYEIDVYFYLPFRAPQGDKYLMNCLNDTGEQNEPSKKFLKAWSEVVKEWSSEYGQKINGWWIDGVYKTKSINKSDWTKVCDAFVVERSSHLIAFNSGEGVSKLGVKLNLCHNWEAGEINDMRNLKKYKAVARGSFKSHMLTYVTQHWGEIGPIKYSFDDIQIYCEASPPDSMLTFDIPIEKNFYVNQIYIDWIRGSIKACNEKIH